MTIASAFGLIFLLLFGMGIIVGALKAARLIDWENHALNSIADALRDYRMALEDEQRLLEPVGAPAEPLLRVQSEPQRGQQGSRAA